MTPDKLRGPTAKSQPAPGKPLPARPVAPVTAPPVKPPPMFRSVDWWAFGVTSLIMLVAYWWTLAPDLTLEDSGELAVASMYAGVPHPPGYPVWTIYTWLFTVLFPVSNIAYRVAFSSAVAGALTCGLVALMVSRGSSMLMEGIAELRDIARRWENEICLVSGFVAGALIGFDGFMWSQAVIVEVYTLTALSLAGVLVTLFRWIYAPHQHRYLYLSWFLFGIAFNNHQSLLVCAVAMEVIVVVVQPTLGRNLLLGNFLAWAVGWYGNKIGLVTTLNDNPPLVTIYNLIGLGSLAGFFWLLWRTRRDLSFRSWLRSLGWALASFIGFMLGALFYLFMPIASMANPPMNWGYARTVTGFFHAFTRGQYERIHPTTGTGTGLDWLTSFLGRVGGQLKMLVDGTVEEINPAYLLIIPVALLAFSLLRKPPPEEKKPVVSATHLSLGLIVLGLIYIVLRELDMDLVWQGQIVVLVAIGCLGTVWAVVEFLRCLQPRERAWLLGLFSFFVLLGPFLMLLFNAATDRQSLSLIKVFFTPAHMFVAMAVGYALTVLVGTLATAYATHRPRVVLAFAVLAGVALFMLAATMSKTMYILPRGAAIFALALLVAVTLILLVARGKAPVGALLAAFAFMPGHSILAHWSENEQRGHRFGFWFGHDMFTPPFNDPKTGQPIYPEMAKDAILFGGTDPGRFCPTYMIFCESFIPPEKRYDPKFDRRDVYIITQNALADGTYLNYIRAHYFRSAQIDPPFFSELLRSPRERETNYRTNWLARLMVPVDRFFLKLGDNIEKRRRTGSSLFTESHFTDLAGLAAKLRDGGPPVAVSKYLHEHLSPETRQLLSGPADQRLARALARDLNRLLEGEYEANRNLPKWQQELGSLTNEVAVTLDKPGRAGAREAKRRQQRIEELQKLIADARALTPFYETNRFAEVPLSEYLRDFIAQNPQLHSRIRLNRLLLEAAYPREIAKSQGGLYPDREIYTPSNEDSQRCFSEYMADAQDRMRKNQLRPGEDVRVVRDPASGQDRVQVSGQVAVMAINGLLTKVIFDKNPKNEFYVEESFPLDWMFPHLTPYGIIMKINRQPVPEMTEEIIRKDHEFWCQFSERLIGNWITYDTSISNICAFAEKTYVRHDYRGFTGDRKFVRDDDAQKAFSKLRSSIAGVYAWRINNARTEAERQRCLKEAEFAFKQAYAFCPYSPEALYRFINILIGSGRVDEALLMAQTSKKLDPYNAQLDRLIDELERIRQQRGTAAAQANLPQLEAEYRARPTNVPNALQLAQALAQLGQTDRVRQIAETLLTNSPHDANAVYFTVQIFSQLRDTLRLEQALQNWVRVSPTPEAWLDFAAIESLLNKTPQAVAALRAALDLNARRLAANPKASNIALLARTDERLRYLRSLPEVQQLLATNK